MSIDKRSYTLDEIDVLRELSDMTTNDVWDYQDSKAERSKAVEEKVRTMMVACVSEEEAKLRIEEIKEKRRQELENMVNKSRSNGS